MGIAGDGVRASLGRVARASRSVDVAAGNLRPGDGCTERWSSMYISGGLGSQQKLSGVVAPAWYNNTNENDGTKTNGHPTTIKVSTLVRVDQ